MKITVVGAGAIGGYLGARLSAAGEEVTFIARNRNLEAINAHGFRLIQEDGSELQAPAVRAVQRYADAGPQDAVLLTVKAHQVRDLLPDLRGLFGPHTTVVTMINGVPWWYFHQLAGPWEGRAIEAVDPGGLIAEHIEPERFKAPVSKDIRGEIWVKLWGNLTFNPISALTHATLEQICTFAPTRDLAARMMTEAKAVAERLGVQFRISLEQRLAGAQAVGAHKTSMLQDVEAGRTLELEALVGAVVELGRITETPTPTIEAIYAVTKLLGQTVQAQGGRLAVTPLS
jgi:2-dehydropantoate 2-reductase